MAKRGKYEEAIELIADAIVRHEQRLEYLRTNPITDCNLPCCTEEPKRKRESIKNLRAAIKRLKGG